MTDSLVSCSTSAVARSQGAHWPQTQLLLSGKIDEGKRLLNVLEQELATKDWIAGDYSIADMAIAPWLRALDFYGAKGVLAWDDFTNVVAYLDRFLERDAVQAGLNVPPREG